MRAAGWLPLAADAARSSGRAVVSCAECDVVGNAFALALLPLGCGASRRQNAATPGYGRGLDPALGRFGVDHSALGEPGSRCVLMSGHEKASRRLDRRWRLVLRFTLSRG